MPVKFAPMTLTTHIFPIIPPIAAIAPMLAAAPLAVLVTPVFSVIMLDIPMKFSEWNYEVETIGLSSY